MPSCTPGTLPCEAAPPSSGPLNWPTTPPSCMLLHRPQAFPPAPPSPPALLPLAAAAASPSGSWSPLSRDVASSRTPDGCRPVGLRSWGLFTLRWGGVTNYSHCQVEGVPGGSRSGAVAPGADACPPGVAWPGTDGSPSLTAVIP